MTETRNKPKAEIKTRQPQKKTPDTFANLRQPHPVEELLGLTQPTPRTPPTPLTAATPPIAPERDFARVANSIVREAVAGGYFIGKSKQVYDFLYQRTRGSIVPKRSIKIPKPELMKGSDIGSERTLLKNLAHLKSIGLIEVGYTDGQHEGNEYTVHLPEEIGLKAAPTPRTPPTPPTARHVRVEVPSVPPAESGVGGVGSELVESTTSGQPKTSFKTKDQDDDEFGQCLRALERELTGRISPAANWNSLFELLVDELKTAASHTGAVSDVPAFLTAHLRRRFAKPDMPLRTGKRAAEPAPLLPEEIEPPAPDEIEEYERLRAELEGKDVGKEVPTDERNGP